jgi:hypothetical protein
VDLIAGRFGEMVYQNYQVLGVPIADAVNRLKVVKPDSQMVLTRRAIGISFGMKYGGRRSNEGRRALACLAGPIPPGKCDRPPTAFNIAIIGGVPRHCGVVFIGEKMENLNCSSALFVPSYATVTSLHR